MFASARYAAVDRYFEERLGLGDAVLDAAVADSAQAELPPIAVSPCQGRMLMILAQLAGARTILEFGTLGGYSAIWLARALPPGGRLVTLELNPKHADVARRNLDRAGFRDSVSIRVGPARDTAAQLGAADGAPFDFVFIDADKPSTADYFDQALRLTRPGSLIVVDNVVREGEVANAASTDPSVLGVRRFFDRVATDPRVCVTAIQTVGAKSHDGFALVRVLTSASSPPAM